MENSFQTSFIPKKPLATGTTGREPRNFLSLLSIFLLLISILASGGIYLYKSYLTKQEDSLSSSLSATRDSFEKDTIDDLELFNKRTEAATQILTNHTILSAMFARLGEITIPSVQYITFNQQAGTSGFTVNLKGIAKDYRSIALQSDAFNTTKGRSFKNVLFSDLTKDKDNNVSFSLKFEVDPSLLSYENNSTIPSQVINTTSTAEILPSNEITEVE